MAANLVFLARAKNGPKYETHGNVNYGLDVDLEMAGVSEPQSKIRLFEADGESPKV